MSYTSGMFNRELNDYLFDNVETETQPITQTNISLVASLGYVQNYFNNLINDYLPINNPVFTGSLSTINGSISAPTANITNQNATTFLQNPNISINSVNYPISTRLIGEIKIMIPTTAPPNYLLCNGASVSVTQYQQLFNVINYNYGGSNNTFNLPNFTNAFPVGASSSINGVSSSNLANGAGLVGCNNDERVSYNYGESVTPAPMLLQDAPYHSHFTYLENSQPSTITPIGVQNYLYLGSSYQGISTEAIGTNIAPQIDTISGGDGINITPPFTAVSYYICYS
jgi:microcystin-dependent protein